MDQALSGELLALPEALDYNIKYVSICQHFSSNFFDLFSSPLFRRISVENEPDQRLFHAVFLS